METAFTCDSCSRINIGSVTSYSLPANFLNESGAILYWDANDPSHWTPSFITGQDFPDVPEAIGGPASESHQTFSIGAVNSAVMMARAVIEAVAKDNGASGKTLFAKIDALHSAGKIKDFTKDTAHIIRAFGNDMAHGDFTVALDKEDAEGVLEFMDLILREVYQDPAKLMRLKAKNEERKAAQP